MRLDKKSVLPNTTAKSSTSADNSVSLNVLYLSVTGRMERPYLDPSTRYRCFYPVEAARSFGHRAFVATQTALTTVDPLMFDMVVIHRPAFTPELLLFVRKAKLAGVRLIADYDDLIFDPAHASESSMFMKSSNFTSVLATFERNTDALRLFDEFTVSTQPLRDHVLAIHPRAKVHVLPNSVPPSLWSMIVSRGYQTQSERPFIGYFPGTATHDKDFSIAAESLANFCRTRHVPLRIVGPVMADQEIFRGVTVERLQLQPFADMFDSLAQCRVVVAPLTATLFNRAKSHIKLIEAVLSCAACVASDIPDMAQHGCVLSSVSLARAAVDWPSALKERWDCFNLDEAARVRSSVTKQFSSISVYASLFADAG